VLALCLLDVVSELIYRPFSTESAFAVVKKPTDNLILDNVVVSNVDEIVRQFLSREPCSKCGHSARCVAVFLFSRQASQVNVDTHNYAISEYRAYVVSQLIQLLKNGFLQQICSLGSTAGISMRKIIQEMYYSVRPST
jgi:hypothetical protein